MTVRTHVIAVIAHQDTQVLAEGLQSRGQGRGHKGSGEVRGRTSIQGQSVYHLVSKSSQAGRSISVRPHESDLPWTLASALRNIET